MKKGGVNTSPLPQDGLVAETIYGIGDLPIGSKVVLVLQLTEDCWTVRDLKTGKEHTVNMMYVCLTGKRVKLKKEWLK